MFSEWWWSSGAEANEDDFEIKNSLRFRGAQNLNRAFANTSDTYTFSFWTKIATNDADLGYLFSAGGNNPSLLKGQVTQSGFLYNQDAGGATGTISTNPRRFRDPSAWYHIVYQSDGGTHRIFINGELCSTPNTGSNNYNGTFRIGVNTDGASADFQGLMADWYAIDGQVLQPTAFGRELTTGQWVPREVDFTPAEMRYSDMTVSSTGAWFGSGYDSKVMFDNDLETYCQTSTQSGVATFTPTGGIDYTSSVRVYSRRNAPDVLSLNGGADISLGAAGVPGWTEVATGSGTIESMAFSGYYGGSVYAIEVDEEILTNPYLWSADLTSVSGFQANQGPALAFNGNSANFAIANANGDWTFAPRTPIPVTSTVEVFQFNNAGQTSWNGTDLTPNATSVTFTGAGEISAANPITATTTGTGQGCFCNRIVVDGQELIDGANPSYGRNGFRLQFADPDDLGHDSSGNFNHFTPSNFNTNPVGQFSTNLFTGANGSTGFDFAARGNNFAGGVNGPAAGFDNNNGTFCFAQANQSINLVCNLTGITQIVVRTDQTQTYSFAVNQTAVTATRVIDGSAARQTLDLPADFDGNLTLLSIRGSSTTMTPGFSGIFINNRAGALVDNTGTDYDLMQDSPTNSYAVLNPLSLPSDYGDLPTASYEPAVLSDANLKSTGVSSKYGYRVPTILVPVNSTETFYFETTIGSVVSTDPAINIRFPPGAGTRIEIVINNNGNVSGAGASGTGPAFNSAGDVVGLQINMSTKTFRYQVNGGTVSSDFTFDNQGRPAALSHNHYNTALTVNFGQQPFLYQPAGTKKLQTQNLPAATIRDGREQFRALTGPGTVGGTLYAEDANDTSDRAVDRPLGTLTDPSLSGSGTYTPYSGNGSTYSWIWDAGGEVANSTFTVDFHGSTFTVRSSLDGTTWNTEADAPSGDNTITSTNAHRYVRIQGPNWGVAAGSQTMTSASGVPILQAAQNAFDNGLYWIKDRDNNSTHHQLVDTVRGNTLAMWSDDMGAEQNYAAPAGNSVAWCWNAPNTFTPTQTGGLTNMAGRRNVAAGFSILTWNGTGTNATITHGLTDAPEFILFFNQEATSLNRLVYHVGNTSTATANDGHQRSLILNTTAAGAAESSMLNNTAPTDAANGGTVSLGSAGGSNGDADMVAYCWHSVPGYSAFGRYNGNATTNNSFVYTGFRPACVWFKSIAAGGGWQMYDTARSANNPTRHFLSSDSGLAETTGFDIDILSNGFKIRASNGPNAAATGAVYMCWAENPFGSRNTSPANAR